MGPDNNLKLKIMFLENNALEKNVCRKKIIRKKGVLRKKNR